MPIKVSFSQAKENFADLCDQAVDEGKIVRIKRRVKGKGQNRSRDVAIIAADDLDSFIETVYLLRSPKNAERLFNALARTEAQTTPPSSIADLRREVGLSPE
jgi:antitoxin YefM